MGEDESVYENILYLSVFLGALWYAGELCKLAKISPIVGLITVGILLGPNALDFVPLFNNEVQNEDSSPTLSPTASPTINASSSEQQEVEETNASEEVTNFLIILGELGVTFLIFESGLHVNFTTLKKVGFPAFLVAVNGTLFSILLGIFLAISVGFDPYPESLAIGAVIAPTSVGLALKLLFDANVLDSEFGQIIVTAAFTDDIFSLVTLAVILQLASGDLSVWGVAAPFVYSGSFIGFVFLTGIYLVPKYSPRFFDTITDRYSQRARDISHLTLMFLFMAFFGYLGDLIGSHLLGAFLTGVLFNRVPRTHHVWEDAMTDINAWLIMLFFGATVGFAVPIEALLSLEIFWKGMVLGAGTILGKLLAGLHLKQKWVVGWAMVGRGEFSFLVGAIYLITEDGDTGNFLLSEEGFAVAVWALLVAIFIAPLGFGWILSRNLKKEVEQQQPSTPVLEHSLQKMKSIKNFRSVLFGDQKETAPRSEWYVTLAAKYQPGLLKCVMEVFFSDRLFVKSYVNEGDLETILMTFVILIPDPDQKTAKTSGVKMHASVTDMKGKREAMLEFEDDFMRFDIDLYVDRLRHRIERATNNRGEVRVERSNGQGRRSLTSGVLKIEEGDNDVDSAAVSSEREFGEDEI